MKQFCLKTLMFVFLSMMSLCANAYDAYIDDIYSNCSGLTSVTVNNATPVAIGAYTFSNRTNATLYIPFGCKAAYEAADYWKDFKEIVEEAPETVPESVTMTCNGTNTFSSVYPLDFMQANGLNAYIASAFSPSTGELILTEATKVPAGEGLLLKGVVEEYEVPCTETDMYYSNLLKGVTATTTVSTTADGYTNYVLGYGENGYAFYIVEDQVELTAGQAYLRIPATQARSRRVITFNLTEGVVTGLKPINGLQDSRTYYLLDGRRIADLQKGLNIIRNADGRTVKVMK